LGRFQTDDLARDLLNLLDVLLVLNLELMEIDELQIIPGLVLLLDLGICAVDVELQLLIPHIELVDGSVLSLDLLLHVLEEPLGDDFPGFSVFGANDDVTLEFIGLLLDFSDCHVGFFKNRAKHLK
jgi:hypothetical protein